MNKKRIAREWLSSLFGGVAMKAIFFIVCFFSLSYGIVDGSGWKLYMENEFGGWFYDVETITHPSKDTVRVWGKTVYTEKGVMRRVAGMIAIYQKYNDLESKELASKYKDLNYEQHLIELNCPDRKNRTLKGTSHSRDGSILSTYSPETPSWNEVTPGSAGEELYKIVCMHEESKELKDDLLRSREEKPTPGLKMISKIGEYYLGQEIRTTHGLVEFTPQEKAILQSFPGWFDLPGERIFKAPDVTFNRHLWNLTVGAFNGRINILALQSIGGDGVAANKRFEETLRYIKSQMGTPSEQTKAPDRFLWDSTDGKVLLVKREAMGFWSINFLINDIKGKGMSK